MLIIPSILVKTESEFLNQLESIQTHVNLIQLDVADGVFVPQTTWSDPETIKKNVKIDVELHLMVARPQAEIKRWLDVPQIKRVLIHLEATDNISETIELIKQQDWKAGLILNPETTIDRVDQYLNSISTVMFMGVHPGKQGQAFILEVLTKIRSFKQDHPDFFVSVDGGINEDVLQQLITLKVDAICPGSSIFGHGNPAENLEKLTSLISHFVIS